MFKIFKDNPLFFRFWFAAIFSQVASRMHSLILLWLVYKWTGSAMSVGLTMIASSLPSILIAPIAGSSIDSNNKITIMVIADICRMLLMIAMAILHLYGFLDIATIVIATFGISVASAYFNPASLSVMPSIIQKESLPQANAMNQISMSASAIAGPLVGVSIIASLGVLNAFVLGAVFFLASSFLLFNIKDGTHKEKVKKESFIDDIKNGWQTLKKYPMVYDMIAKTAIVNFFFASLIIVIPVISKGNATHIGFMMSAIGVGMLLSSVILSVKKITMDTKKILILSFIFMGLSFLALGISKNSYLSMVALFFIGITLNIFNITIVSLYQRALPLEVLGKIMSFMSAISLSLQPLSYGVMGIMLEYLGYTLVLCFSGFIITISAYQINKINLSYKEQL